tara:strand:+ start:621 stop:908 length:288 start_codon:yes stop_codon:yes gene_type:complete
MAKAIKKTDDKTKNQSKFTDSEGNPITKSEMPVNTLENAIVGSGSGITNTMYRNAIKIFKQENPNLNAVHNYKVFRKYLIDEGGINVPDSINAMR